MDRTERACLIDRQIDGWRRVPLALLLERRGEFRATVERGHDDVRDAGRQARTGEPLR